MEKCVTGIIMNELGEVLIQNHKKVDAYTLPGGKVDKDETEKEAIVRELFEELGILSYRFEEILYHNFDKLEYPANSGNYLDFSHTYFNISKYKGEIINKEPEKHPELLWVKPENIRSLGKISVVMDIYLKSLNL